MLDDGGRSISTAQNLGNSPTKLTLKSPSSLRGPGVVLGSPHETTTVMAFKVHQAN